MGLKEILAAKAAAKAATEGASAQGNAQVAQTPVAPPATTSVTAVAEKVIATTAAELPTAWIEGKKDDGFEQAMKELAVLDSKGSLTFQEKMRQRTLNNLRKTHGLPAAASSEPSPGISSAEQVADSKPTVKENPAPNLLQQMEAAPPEPAPSGMRNLSASLAAAAKAFATVSTEHVPAETPPEITQAYIDVAEKLRELTAASDDSELENGMKNLKKALHENPTACALLLPEEIGLMVISLRRMTNTKLVEGTDPEKKTRKSAAKSAPLTQEQLAKGWDDL